LLGAAIGDVGQPCGSGAIVHRGEVDDGGDVLVALADVTPRVFIDADHRRAVEPGGGVDQDSLPFGQDRVVGGIPRDAESFGDAGDGQVLAHDAFQRPPRGGTPRNAKASPGTGQPTAMSGRGGTMPSVFDVLGQDHREVKRMLSELKKGPTVTTGTSDSHLMLRKRWWSS
jgi:hypothetical protein